MEIPNSLLEQQIDRGTILHSTMFENIDHGKFFVIEDKQEQLDMQYPLRKSDYNFLHHDSFLSATKIEKIRRSRLIETINDGITEIIGNMRKEHMDELLERARESILFSKQQIKQFLY